jgi:hypothetical protein
MRHQTLKGRLAGYLVGITLLTFCVWGGSSSATPQNRGPSDSAANGGIVWAPGVAHSPASLITVFKYTNFSDVSGLTFNGNAQQAGRDLFVTPSAMSQAGSVWYSSQVNVAQGFLTNFGLQIVPSQHSCGSTGDGMAFLVQNSGLSALGADGGNLGYTGIANSLAVEFDTFLNGSYFDPNNNHIGIQSCGAAANTADHGTCNLGLQSNLATTLADGNIHRTSISYFPGVGGSRGLLTVSIDNQVVLTSALDLSTLLSLNGDDAWVGFTAGTGSCFETNAITAWELASAGSAYGEERKEGSE